MAPRDPLTRYSPATAPACPTQSPVSVVQIAPLQHPRTAHQRLAHDLAPPQPRSSTASAKFTIRCNRFIKVYFSVRSVGVSMWRLPRSSYPAPAATRMRTARHAHDPDTAPCRADAHAHRRLSPESPDNRRLRHSTKACTSVTRRSNELERSDPLRQVSHAPPQDWVAPFVSSSGGATNRHQGLTHARDMRARRRVRLTSWAHLLNG